MLHVSGLKQRFLGEEKLAEFVRRREKNCGCASRRRKNASNLSSFFNTLLLVLYTLYKTLFCVNMTNKGTKVQLVSCFRGRRTSQIHEQSVLGLRVTRLACVHVVFGLMEADDTQSPFRSESSDGTSHVSACTLIENEEGVELVLWRVSRHLLRW